MNNGLVKERLTYFCKDKKVVYQSFNTILGNAKVLIYVDIGNKYICANEFIIDHPISTEELKSIAIEYEFLREAK